MLFCLTYFNDSLTHQVPSFTLFQVLFLSSCLFCFLILISAFFFTKLSSRIPSHPLYYNSFLNIIASFISVNIHVSDSLFYWLYFLLFSLQISFCVQEREVSIFLEVRRLELLLPVLFTEMLMCISLMTLWVLSMPTLDRWVHGEEDREKDREIEREREKGRESDRER